MSTDQHALSGAVRGAWDDIRRMAEQLDVQVHLGGMEARERWRELKPRVELLEREIAAAGSDLGRGLAREIELLRDSLHGLWSGVDHPDP